MYLKKGIRIISIPIVVMVIGYLLLVISCLIPKWMIQNEIKESAEIICEQGKYVTGVTDGFLLDNSTDSDCLSIVYNRKSDNPFLNALNAFQVGKRGMETGIHSVDALKAAANDDWDSIGDHSYLWHGYRVWLSLLLIKYNINDIRTFLLLVTNFSMVLFCIYMCKIKKNIMVIIPFLFSFLYFNLHIETLSLLFFNDIFLMLLGCTLVIWLCNNNKKKYLTQAYTLIGSLVAFSSMLMLPTLTLGFPLIIILLLYPENEKIENLKNTIIYSLSWLVGYALTMGTKIMISLLYIKDGHTGKERVINYTGADSYDIKSRFEIVKNVFIKALTDSEIKKDILIILFICLLIICIYKKKINIKSSNFSSLILVMLYPAIWCFFMPGHSGHGWTSWNFAISIFAIMAIFFGWILENKRNEE